MCAAVHVIISLFTVNMTIASLLSLSVHWRPHGRLGCQIKVQKRKKRRENETKKEKITKNALSREIVKSGTVGLVSAWTQFTKLLLLSLISKTAMTHCYPWLLNVLNFTSLLHCSRLVLLKNLYFVESMHDIINKCLDCSPGTGSKRDAALCT